MNQNIDIWILLAIRIKNEIYITMNDDYTHKRI